MKLRGRLRAKAQLRILEEINKELWYEILDGPENHRYQREGLLSAVDTIALKYERIKNEWSL